ncbi:Arf3-interacting protein 1, N-terminal domain [Phytophthora cactorum]|nr:Arf3-interacting protein 1, N-terminal domain [Phytophthora cactorum]
MAMTADDASTPAFDLTKGSTLRASYPTPFAHYSPEFFADIMLPEGVHNREEDFTIFFLNRQNAYKLSDTEEQKSNESQEQTADEAQDPLQSFMYCLSVSCFALKDVLNLAVLKIVGSKSEEESEKVLQELLAVVNAVDISGVRGLSSMERRLMKRTISRREDTGEGSVLQNSSMWEDIPIPLQFKICSTDDQHDDGTLTQLLQTFGDQTMVLFNAVLTGQRVIMLGYNRPAGKYANLTDLGFLSTPGYIAGVTNPMFKTKREWWDVLCDISTGEVFVSAPIEKEDHDASDRNFVLDGVAAGYDEEWVRCMFEEYMLKNVVDIALGEANYLSPDALAKRSAVNNKRITKWARTDSYKRFMDSPHRMHFHSPAKYTLYMDDIEKTGVDMKRHIRSLQGDMVVLDDTLLELQEFLSFLPVLRGGLQTIAQGIFHPSISVKHNTVVLLKRLEQFSSTVSSMQRLNPFLLMSYQRIHDIVNPDTRD